jgi:hypothetical protein
MFRTTALAAALAATSMGASAGPVTLTKTLDLTGLGQQAIDANNGTGAPVAVGEIDGFVFSDNVFAYHSSMLKPGGNPGDDLDTPALDTTGPFIMNGDRTTGLLGGPPFMPLTISLGKGFTDQKRYFQSIDTSIFSSATFTVRLYSGPGDTPLSSPSYTPTYPGVLKWEPWSPGTPWSETLAVDRIEISVEGTAGYVGLKDISITLSGGTTVTPNPAPEPAGYALVGIALLAAGAASRRRA